MEVYNFKNPTKGPISLKNHNNLTKEPTCFKTHNNPSCIDLVLTNRKKQFMPSALIETGVSGFHRS